MTVEELEGANYWKPPMKLWQHQIIGVDRLIKNDRYALFLDLGCGKTLTAIAGYCYKCLQKKARLKTLVLCPSTTVNNWRRECAKIMPDKLLAGVEILEGAAPKKIKTLGAAGKFFFITNLDVVNSGVWQEIVKHNWDVLILDESHKFKEPSAKRTQKMIAFSDKVPTIWALSGTPIVNSSMDIWSQFRIFDGGKALSTNFYAFRSNYFEDRNASMPRHKYFPNWQPRKDTYEKLSDIIEQNSYRVMKEQAIDLPPLMLETSYAELTKEQSKLYRDMEEFFVAFLEESGSAVVADLAITKMLRLQQILAGVITLDNGETKRIKSGKDEVLRDLLEVITPREKAVVWTNFAATYGSIEALCAEMKIKCVKVTGQENSREKQENIAKFASDPSIRVAICNQKAAGTGTDGLQVAPYSIYYSKNFDQGDNRQSQDRTYRGGSEIHKKIMRIDIITRDTIDEQIHESLLSKASLAELLLKIRKRRCQT